MAAYFFDTSAIVKRYVAEVGSSWVFQLSEPSANNRIYVARIAAVEIASAVARRKRDGSLSADNADELMKRFLGDFGSLLRIVEMSPTILTLASNVATSLGLRAYDAVQLAAALYIHRRRIAGGLSQLTFVSSDSQLNAACETLGLSLDDPNAHP